MKQSSVLRAAIVVTLLFVLLTLGFGSVPVLAGDAYHVTTRGTGGDAAWNSLQGEPVPGVIYEDAYISAAEQVIREDGSQSVGAELYLSRYAYKFDRKGNWILVSNTYGSGPARLSVGRQLSSASATATVSLTRCTMDRRGNVDCVPAGSAAVSVAWVGVSEITQSKTTYHEKAPGSSYTSQHQGSWRPADASATVNGVELGASNWGSLYDARDNTITICRGACS